MAGTEEDWVVWAVKTKPKKVESTAFPVSSFPFLFDVIVVCCQEVASERERNTEPMAGRGTSNDETIVVASAIVCFDSPGWKRPTNLV